MTTTAENAGPRSLRTYGAEPWSLRKRHLDWDEVLHYLYLPIKFPHSEIRLPQRLRWAGLTVGECMIDYLNNERGDWAGSYVYLTARHGYATPDNPLNRPGWHCDGFGTNDINYFWADRWGTRVALQEFDTVSTDHRASLDQFDCQVKSEAIVEMCPTELWGIDPYVVHATPIIEAPGGWRKFLKISVSEHQYNMKGNSHNHLFDYDWEMFERDLRRNDTQYGQADFYVP